jgi:hypothetical protein
MRSTAQDWCTASAPDQRMSPSDAVLCCTEHCAVCDMRSVLCCAVLRCAAWAAREGRAGAPQVPLSSVHEESHQCLQLFALKLAAVAGLSSGPFDAVLYSALRSVCDALSAVLCCVVLCGQPGKAGLVHRKCP